MVKNGLFPLLYDFYIILRPMVAYVSIVPHCFFALQIVSKFKLEVCKIGLFFFILFYCYIYYTGN
jgi:hypothetical protein